MESTCATCSQGEVKTAAPFVPNAQNLQTYSDNTLNSWGTYSLPTELDKDFTWSVYKLSSKKLFSHYSLLFMCNSHPYTDGFTMELGFNDTDPKAQSVIPVTRCVYKHQFDTCELVKLGIVQMSVENIVDVGLTILSGFGEYDKYSNNCQTFCVKVAEKLGIKQPITDVEHVFKWGAIGAGVLTAIGIGLAVYFKKKSSK